MNKSIFADRRATPIGLACFALLAVTVIAQYAVVFAVSRFVPALAETDVYTWLLALLPIYAFGLPACLAVLRACPAEPRPEQPMRVSHWLLALVVAFGLLYAGSLIGNLLMMAISALRGTAIPNPLESAVLDSNPLWTFLATVVAAPLGEEFLFRRVIIDRTRRWGELPAVLLSAAMFGAFHLNLYQFFYAFFVGLVFGYVYVKTGRLRYTIALHAAINFCGSVVAPVLLRQITPFLEAAAQEGMTPEMLFGQLASALPALLLYMAYALLLMGCALATLILGIVLHRRLRFAPGEADPRTLWCNFGVIAFFVLCAGITILSMR